MRPEEVILKPVLTEKSTKLREKLNKYTFIINKSANKIMVKNAVKELFSFEPKDVNIINCHGKKKRVRYKYGFTSSFKKAIITLAEDEKLSIYEGV